MNTFISPNLKRTKDYLGKDGSIIKRQVQGKEVETPKEEKE